MNEDEKPDDLTPEEDAELQSLIQQLKDNQEPGESFMEVGGRPTTKIVGETDEGVFEETSIEHHHEVDGTPIPEIRDELKSMILRQKEWADLYSYEDVQATAVGILRELHGLSNDEE